MIGTKVGVLLALLVTLTSETVASAQEFPTKPIELAVPYAAGGSHDLTARALASVVHQYLGQPMVVVLKPGGGGAPGSQYVIRAKPDGYTLMLGGTGPNTIFALSRTRPSVRITLPRSRGSITAQRFLLFVPKRRGNHSVMWSIT